MTYDLNKLDTSMAASEASSISNCTSCKCMMCQFGYGSEKPCPKGNNCNICNGRKCTIECNAFNQK